MQCIYQCVEQKPCNTPGVDDLCTQECIKECSSATSQSSEKDNSQAIAGFAPSTEGSKNYEICVSACELLSSDWATRVCKKECGLIQ